MKRVGVLCLVLTLCLATVGASYASWGKTLTMDGEVDTGQLSVEFLNCTVTDNEQPFVPGGPSDTGTAVINCLDSDGDGELDTIVVSIENGYMCYSAFVGFDIHNSGSVPVVLHDLDILEGVAGAIELSLVGIAIGDQIHPSESKPCSLEAHVNTNDPGTYTFQMIFEFVNWNEGGGS